MRELRSIFYQKKSRREAFAFACMLGGTRTSSYSCVPVAKAVVHTLNPDNCSISEFPTLRQSDVKIRRRLSFAALLAASAAGIELLTRSGVTDRTAYADALVIFGSAFASSLAGFAFSALSGAYALLFAAVFSERSRDMHETIETPATPPIEKTVSNEPLMCRWLPADESDTAALVARWIQA